jgi:hypothetical protein
VAGLVPSLAYLSLPAVYRRGWGSLYDALAAGRLDPAALREFVARYPLDDGQPIYALDTSVWPRDDAETSPGRGHYFSSSRQSAGQPIATGWSYAWLAQLSFTHDSWTAPIDVQRVPAGGDAHAVAAAQIWDLLEHLPAEGPAPLCVLDAGYDPVTLARELAELDGVRVAVLVRVRSDRCFYADPLPAAYRPTGGRPRRHGQKFACGDERTWWAPTAQHREQHAQYGRIRVRAWAGVHAKTQNHPQHGSYRTRPLVRGTLVLVEVERLPRQTRIPKRLWLWWRVQTLRTWRSSDELTCTGSTWSTPTHSVSRPSTGPRPTCVLRTRLISGPGWWCWPTPSCAWHAAPSPMCTCPGRLPNAPLAVCSPRPVSDRCLRSSWWSSTRRRTRQNLAVAHQDARKACARDRRCAARRSKRPPDFVTPSSPSQNRPSIRWLGRCSWLKGKLRIRPYLGCTPPGTEPGGSIAHSIRFLFAAGCLRKSRRLANLGVSITNQPSLVRPPGPRPREDPVALTQRLVCDHLRRRIALSRSLRRLAGELSPCSARPPV